MFNILFIFYICDLLTLSFVFFLIEIVSDEFTIQSTIGSGNGQIPIR